MIPRDSMCAKRAPGFCALRAKKRNTQKKKYHSAACPEPDEAKAKRQLRKSQVKENPRSHARLDQLFAFLRAASRSKKNLLGRYCFFAASSVISGVLNIKRGIAPFWRTKSRRSRFILNQTDTALFLRASHPLQRHTSCLYGRSPIKQLH